MSGFSLRDSVHLCDHRAVTSNAASYRESPSPFLVAAWMALGMIDIDRVPWWAARWLADGHDGPVVLYRRRLRTSDLGCE
jgi:hypothetical protein